MAFAPELFVDRFQELELLRDAVKRADEGQGAVIVVHGERGIGKTALLRRLEALIDAEWALGGVFALASYDRTRGAPFEPFATLLRTLTLKDAEFADVLAKVAPNWAEGRGAPDAIEQEIRLRAEYVRAIAAMAARRRPFVLAVDDAGRLEPAAFELLEELAPRAPIDGYALVIATGPDDRGRGTALRERLNAEPGAKFLELGRFGPEEIRELLKVAVESDVPDAVVSQLTDMTDGLPARTVPLLTELAQSGVLNRAAGEQTLDELAAVVRETAEAIEPALLRAGYLTDVVRIDQTVTDEIGLDAEVDALACLMIDRDVTPPLSIGLFGDWGSGKSYFMRLLQQRVAQLADRSAQMLEPRRAYCSDVRQITFNAWHYADDNLWASLLERIFQGLGDPAAVSKIAQRLVETGRAPPGGILNYIGRRRGEEQARLEEGEREKAEADERLEALAPVATAVTSPLQAISEAGDLAKDPAVTAAQARLTATYGPGAAARAKEASQAGDALGRLASDLLVLWSLLRSGHGARRRIALAGGITLVTLLVALFVLAVSEPVWFTALTGGLVAASAVVRAFARGATAAVNDEVRTAAEQASAQAESQKQAGQQKIDQATAALEALEAGRARGEYLLDRAAEFRSRQGLIALIREELEQLGDALPSSEGGTERVVLYIDDLDRCGTRRVVQVLEAVHLLLAFPLFVVVVGVDARWLLSSLRHYYRAQFVGGLAAATPQQYLEKIFQIPFAIQPIGPDGFERLMNSMLRPTQVRPAAPERIADKPENAPTAADEDTVSESGAAPKPVRDREERPEAPAAQEIPNDDAIGEPVQFTRDEREFASTLQPVVRSPRSAKRLVNLYRIIRTWSAGAGYAQQVERDHRGILVLLALLVASPGDAVNVFAALRADGDNDSMSMIIGQQAPEADGVLAALQRLIEAEPDLDDPDLYRRWLPRVARFSFDMSLRG